jgi:predicted GTPase
MKFLLFVFLFIFQLSYSSEKDVSSWFKNESEEFLLIMNNSEGEDNENYDSYSVFIEKNFAIKA